MASDQRPPGDGNAGNLLEDLLGVPENALPVADYGIYEIKTHKRGSGAKIKIFSLQPYPRPFSKAPFLEVVGWSDRNHENRRRFSYTKGVSGNSRGFRIQREGNLLSFIHDPRRVERDSYCLPYEDEETYGEYADRVRAHPNFAIELPRYWDIAQTDDNGNENCERRIIDKLQNVLFVERTQRRNPEREQENSDITIVGYYLHFVLKHLFSTSIMTSLTWTSICIQIMTTVLRLGLIETTLQICSITR